MRNSTRLWIWRDPSLPCDNWQPFIDWGTIQGRLSLPTADVLSMSSIVKQSMLTDVNKLSSCSRFSDSVVGFTGQKTQPTESTESYPTNGNYFRITTALCHLTAVYFLVEVNKFCSNTDNRWTNRISLHNNYLQHHRQMCEEKKLCNSIVL